MWQTILMTKMWNKQNNLLTNLPLQTGTQVPQETQTDANTIVRLPQTVPWALKIHKQKGKSKQNLTRNYANSSSWQCKSTMGTNAFPFKNATTLCDLDMGKIPETNTG